MKNEDVLVAVIEIFTKVFPSTNVKITKTTAAEDIPEWDSFSHISIIMEAEERFGVSFNATETEAFQSVSAIAAAIIARQAH